MSRGLGRIQREVLQYLLAHPGVALTSYALARYLGCRPPTVHRTLMSLHARGLVKPVAVGPRKGLHWMADRAAIAASRPRRRACQQGELWPEA